MMKRVGLASLSLLGSLSLTPSLHAQPTPPTAAPAEPAPVEPAPPASATPPAPAPSTPSATVSATAASNAGDGYDVGAHTESPASGDDNEPERAWRESSLHLGSALSGSTGLLHVVEAGAGAPGTFRFTATGSYFAGSGFLCNSASNCPSFNNERAGADDDVTRAGAHLGLSVTVLPFLEAFAGFHNHATSDNRGRPQLLQVLGDTNIGLKGFLPHTPDGIF